MSIQPTIATLGAGKGRIWQKKQRIDAEKARVAVGGSHAGPSGAWASQQVIKELEMGDQCENLLRIYPVTSLYEEDANITDIGGV